MQHLGSRAQNALNVKLPLLGGLFVLFGGSISGCASHWNAPTPIALTSAPAPTPAPTPAPNSLTAKPFVRLAQIEGEGEVAEIVVASRDGKVLLYNDAKGGKIGFVDLKNPAKPRLTGMLLVGGEPTSLALTRDGRWGLTCVRATSPGEKSQLVVFALATRRIVRRIPLSGQPDCLKISADNRYAAIAIENERGDIEEAMPQAPAGNLTIIDLNGAPAAWKSRVVSLLKLPIRFPSDPEPEYISINARNQAAVSLQENNAVCIVDLRGGRVTEAWSCGTTQHAADLTKDERIDFSQTLRARREPDSLAWTPQGHILTANEGDYDLDETDFRAGGRNITLWSRRGKVLWDSANQLDEMAAQNGAYLDKRSAKRGVEPEGVEIGSFGGKTLALVGCERARGVAVYDLSDEAKPQPVQWLETGDNPEGVWPIASRKLFVTANEGDNTLSIFGMK